MARLAGIELQDKWKIDFALTRLRGIGWPLSKKILSELSIGGNKRVTDLTPDELSKIASKIEEFPIEGDLIRRVLGDIQRLKTIGSYRGLRHSRNLPVRGQKTRRNARTKRGKRKTIGAFKKEEITKKETHQKLEEKK